MPLSWNPLVPVSPRTSRTAHPQGRRVAWSRTLAFTLLAPALVAGGAQAAGHAGAAGTGSPRAAAPLSATPAPIVWDLSPLFPNDAAWDAERLALQALLPEVGSLKARFGTDAAAAREVLDRLSALRNRLSRLWVYASTQASTDTRDRRNQERSALMSSLWAQFSSASAWLNPAIQELGEAKVAQFLQSDAGLQKHAAGLRNVLRLSRHNLGAPVEGALAAMAPITGASGNVRSLLLNADAQWPSITVEGKSVKLNDVGYSTLRQHPDRAVRKQAFDTFWQQYAQYENTLGALLAQRVQFGVINARLRGYASPGAAALAGDEIPEAVVRTLVAQTNAGLPTLHRYFKLRQKMLKLPDLHYYDIYPPLVDSPARYSMEASAQLTLESTRPLGTEYQTLLAQALKANTMHAYPAEGKTSGAYATGVYGLTPYIFLNHRDTYDSLTTYAHEWGHGMHSILAQGAQPSETAGYPLFIAEIAAITNEALLSHHMRQRAQTSQERLFVLGQALERVRGAFFRQTMFAEFELAAHDAQQRGEALNGKRFTELYCGLLRKYHGADQGVMQIDPAYCKEWAFIPHFHRPFYVFAYATSTAAAQFFADRILAGGPVEAERYLSVLRGGNSLPPQELLGRAGLDLTQAEPYQQLFRRMNAIMDEMEALLKG